MHFKLKKKIFMVALSIPLLGMANTNISSKLDNDTVLNKKHDHLAMYLKTQFLSQDSEINKANRFQTQVGVGLSKYITSNLHFDFDVSANLEAGNSDSLYANNEFNAQNDLTFKRGVFHFEALRSMDIRVGALAMAEADLDLLIGHNAFLGAREELYLELPDFRVGLIGYQTTPRNINYSNRLDQVEEGNPSFFMETLHVKLGSELNFIESKTSQFAYANLSNSVAGASYYFGNSVDLENQFDGEFVYSYIGNGQLIRGQVEIGKFQLELVSEFVVNNSAPEENQGTRFGGSLTYKFGDKSIAGFIHQFRNEADSSVAFYNSTTFRRNNREGSYFGLEYRDEKEKLGVDLEYVRSEEIVKSQLSEDSQEDIVVFVIRKDYDIL